MRHILKDGRPFTLILLSCLGIAWAQPTGGESPVVRERQGGSLSRSQGEYKGHRWEIEESGLVRWDGKPYVRFAFTGNGTIPQMVKAGFDQFTLTPGEEWPISGPSPRIVESVNDTSDWLDKAGATYYASLNALWPWRYGKLIAESDLAPVFIRDVRDVTEHSGRQDSLDFQVRLPIHPSDQDRVKPEHTRVVLFDLEHGRQQDLTHQVESVIPSDAKPGRENERTSGEHRREGKAFRLRLKSSAFPESISLRLVVAMEVGLAEVPGANGLPTLWKPGIREFYRRSLEAFRPAYAKSGLRGLQFGDEINTYTLSLLTARTYLDLRRDAVALQAYRDWLGRRLGGIQEFNRQCGSRYDSFDQVEWRVPLHPFAPELAGSEVAAEREEGWIGAKTTWGLADSMAQLRTISRLQEEFRVWWYGHWLAEYGKLAKEAIGPVPVFVCSAGISGEANRYLAMHRWALREGVDGLIRNHYGNGGAKERETLASLAHWMFEVQQDSGKTKHLWANEVGYVRPQVTDAEWAAMEARELGAGNSFGSQWAFPSKTALRDMLELLTRYGYRGFNRFLMNPSTPRSAQEVQWMAGLRPDIVSWVSRQGKPPEASRPDAPRPEER